MNSYHCHHDFKDYEILTTEKGYKLVHRENGKGFVENLTQRDFIPVNIIDKYKREISGIDLADLTKYLKDWEIEYLKNKGRSPSHDHIIQVGVKYIKDKDKQND